MAKVLGNLEIDNGNLGIGTSSPNAMLHVTNSIQVDGGDTFGVDNAGHQIYMSSGGSGLGGEFGSGYARNLIKSDGSATIQIGDNTSLISRILLDAGSSGTNGYISLQTKQVERVRINHDGNVGIGTTSPSEKLHIVGSNGSLRIDNASSTKSFSMTVMDSNNRFRIYDNTSSAERFTIVNGGNVGIGTSSPVQPLQVDGNVYSNGGDFYVNTNRGIKAVGNLLFSYNNGSSYQEGMRITSAGNVGIGTSSPSRRLTVVDNSNTLLFGEHGTSDVAEFKIIADEAHDAAIYFGDTVDNVRGGIYYDTSLNNMQFRGYNNATRMIINSNGAVGIGTGTPAQKLDVSGNIQTSGRIDFSNANVHITRNGNELQLSGYSGWRFYDMQGTSTRMFLSQTGSLGIGTDAPDEKLHIVGDLKVDSDLPRIYLTDSSHNPDYSIVNNNGNFAVFDDTNSAYRLYVNSSGYVGIGTSTPAALLDVNGTAQMSTGITENVHYVGGSIQHWGDSGTGLYFETDELRFYTGGAEEMRLENDGDLHVDGDVIAYSTTVSDERLKDDIKTIDSACEKVCSLRGVEYTWNSGSRKGQREIGVIAQEVEKVIPEIVREKKLALVDDEVYKTVDYEKLVAVLIEANKELCDRVSKLESKLDGITE